MAEHPLARFIRESNTTCDEVARWLHVSAECVRQYIRGKPIPRDRAVQLSLVSGGRLAVTELLFPEGIPPGARLNPDPEHNPGE